MASDKQFEPFVKEVSADDSSEYLLPNSHKKFPVAITRDKLPKPGAGPWVAIVLCLVMAACILFVTFFEIRLLSIGYMDPVYMQIFNSARFLIGLAATSYITGQILILWLYEIGRERTDEKLAQTRTILAMALVNIGELKDKFRFWQATLFILTAASVQAAWNATIVPSFEERDLSTGVTKENGTLRNQPCSLITSSQNPLETYNWQLMNGSWVTALTGVPNIGSLGCPWYAVPSILGLSSQTINYAYSMAGAPVHKLAIGAPAVLGSASGAFEPIFGTEKVGEGLKPTWLDKNVGFINSASACLPVLTENPVKCYPLGPVTFEPDGKSFSFGGKNCTRPVKWNTNLTITAETWWSLWSFCERPESNHTEVGVKTLVAGAFGISSDAFATLVNTKPIRGSNNISSISLACDFNIKSQIHFKMLDFGPETIATGTTVFTVGAKNNQPDCTPKSQSGNGSYDASWMTGPSALAIGMTGVQALVMDGADDHNYPSLLSQTYLQLREGPFNFDGSLNWMEDLLGIAIGATLGVYWGETLPRTIHDGYETTVSVTYTRLGRKSPAMSALVLPFIAMAGIGLYAILRKRHLEPTVRNTIGKNESDQA